MILPRTSCIYAFQNTQHRIVVYRKNVKCFPRNCHIHLYKYCPPKFGPFLPAVQGLEWVGLSCLLLVPASCVSPIPCSPRSSLGSNSFHAWRTAGRAPRGSAGGAGHLRQATVPSADTLTQPELSLSSCSWEAQVALSVSSIPSGKAHKSDREE